MNIAELTSVVQDTIRRPDMEALVRERVLSSITAMHSVANCILDRIEFEMVVQDAPAAIGRAPYHRDIRTIETVILADAEGNFLSELELMSAGEVLKRRRLGNLDNTCYVADGYINYNSTVAASFVVGTGYCHEVKYSVLYNTDGTRKDFDDPDIAEYSTWLMQQYPIAIIDNAIGYTEILRGNTQEGRYNLQVVRDEHIPYIQNLASGYAGQ